MNNAIKANKHYADLYGSCLSLFVQLPPNATIEQIATIADSNTCIGYEHNIKVGDKCIIAIRKYTWRGNVVKTNYLHIYHVKDFETKQVLAHWRQQKDGTYKTV